LAICRAWIRSIKPVVSKSLIFTRDHLFLSKKKVSTRYVSFAFPATPVAKRHFIFLLLFIKSAYSFASEIAISNLVCSDFASITQKILVSTLIMFSGFRLPKHFFNSECCRASF
jgi:hypothetical protein